MLDQPAAATTLTFTVGAYRFDGVLVATTAPADRDIDGSTIPLNPCAATWNGMAVRTVLVTRQALERQLARYCDIGSYGEPSSLHSVDEITDLLLARIERP